MKAELKSGYGDIDWKIGEWVNVKGDLSLCNNGLHCCENIIDAMGFVNCEILAEVETRGNFLKGPDKYCFQEMRIIKTWKWEKEHSVKLAIFAAELVIEIFEKEYPADKRPRAAIEAAKTYLKSPSKKAAEAAAKAAKTYLKSPSKKAVWAVAKAVWATGAAAEAAAGAAEWAARAAAGAAAWAAEAAAGAARAAVWAAGAEIKQKCHDYVLELLLSLRKKADCEVKLK
jgi:hypothetical protein